MQMKLQNKCGGEKPHIVFEELNAALHCCSLRLKEAVVGGGARQVGGARS